MLYADSIDGTGREEPVKEESVKEPVKQESVKEESVEQEAVKEESMDEIDIEKEIHGEIEGIKHAKEEALFLPVKIDIQCGKTCSISASTLSNCDKVIFFKTRQPVETVSFVHRICLDAAASARTKTSRWIKRLTPMTRMGKATEKGLEEVSKIVLAPVFHSDDATAKKVRLILHRNIQPRLRMW